MLNTPLAILLATTFMFYPATITVAEAPSRSVTIPITKTVTKKPVRLSRKLSSHEPTSRILNYMVDCGQRHNVKPEVLLAVAKIEGQDLRDGLIRVGPMGYGTYSGPMGIKYIFGRPPYNWDIDDYRVNIDRAARVLGGDIRKRLKKYNASFNGRYLNAILCMINKYEEEKVFERPDNKQMFKFTNLEVAQNFLRVEQRKPF
jgi:hypothetical protein